MSLNLTRFEESYINHDIILTVLTPNMLEGIGIHNALADIDECEGVECDKGVCVDGLAMYDCVCDPGYTGDHCQTGRAKLL